MAGSAMASLNAMNGAHTGKALDPSLRIRHHDLEYDNKRGHRYPDPERHRHRHKHAETFPHLQPIEELDVALVVGRMYVMVVLPFSQSLFSQVDS